MAPGRDRQRLGQNHQEGGGGHRRSEGGGVAEEGGEERAGHEGERSKVSVDDDDYDDQCSMQCIMLLGLRGLYAKGILRMFLPNFEKSRDLIEKNFL